MLPLVDTERNEREAKYKETIAALKTELEETKANLGIMATLRIDESEPSELAEIQRLDEESVRAQKEGNHEEALEWMERSLYLRQQLFGPESNQFWDACVVVGQYCNQRAMSALQKNKAKSCLELLKKADVLTERDPPSLSMTYNNLACLYRRQGKLTTAFKYLKRALKIEVKLERSSTEADTHLNLCAVLSQLGQHQLALDHAQSALILLQEELYKGIDSPSDSKKKKVSFSDYSDENAENDEHDASSARSNESSTEERPQIPMERVAILAVAYHNIGVQQEYLSRDDASLTAYRKGLNVSEQHLGPSHAMSIALRRSYKDVTSRVEAVK